MSDIKDAECLQLIADAEGHAVRARKAGYVEAKVELSNETYPFMQIVIEHFGLRLEKVEAALAEVIEADELANSGENFIQPDLAAQIGGTIGLGRVLARLAMELPQDGGAAPAELVKRLREAAAAFMTAAGMVEESVEAAIVEDVEEGDEEEDEDEGEEGEEE